MEKDYDNLRERMDDVEEELEVILKQQREKFKDPSIKYVHIGKNGFQLEIQKTTLSRIKIPISFSLMSETKVIFQFST